jgi:predicted nucleic acid-binding protein
LRARCRAGPSLKIDVARALRRIKPETWAGALKPRPIDALAFVDSAPPFGPPLLLDTCVYLDTLEGRLPETAKALIKTRPVRHVTIVLGELSHFFGRLPNVPENRGVLVSLTKAIGLIEERHVTRPSDGASLEAGILCGLVFRLGGFQRGQEVAALNDATIYTHALESGQTVLTRNRNDFDRMNQIMPAGRVLFYSAN